MARLETPRVSAPLAHWRLHTGLLAHIAAFQGFGCSEAGAAYVFFMEREMALHWKLCGREGDG